MTLEEKAIQLITNWYASVLNKVELDSILLNRFWIISKLHQYISKKLIPQ